MSISGNLSTMGVADLLGWAHDKGKTGALVVEEQSREKRIFFENGRVVATSSSDPAEFLSNLVVREGLIEEELLDETLARLDGSDQLLGRYLINNDLVSQDALADVLLRKTRESVFELFTWEQGDFHFVDDERLGQDLTSFALDVPDLIREGEERLDLWQKIRRFIPEPQVIPVSVGFLDDPSLPGEARRILQLVDDERSVDEICRESRSSEFEVCRTLVEAIERGRLKIVRARSPEPAPTLSASATTGITTLDCEGMLAAAERHFQDGNFEKTLRYLKAARMLEPESGDVKERVQETEQRIDAVLGDAGVTADAVPELNRPIDELTSVGVSPEAGFLLTRIDGSYDLRSILKITPMPALEARVLVLRLLEQGHLRLSHAS